MTSSSTATTTTVGTPATLWKCSDRLCNTGQTYKPRASEGRKVVSDFFGRNKNATKAIDDDVWHWQCRKGYQRAKYAADKAAKEGDFAKQKDFYMSHLRDQLIRIKLWRPAATFTVQLSKPAKARLDSYHSILRRNGNDVQAAADQSAAAHASGRSSAALFSALAKGLKPDHAEHIDTHFAGGGAATADFILDTILPWIEQEFAAGRMTLMPPIEFLISDPAPGEVSTDPATNYDRWAAHVDGTDYAAPVASATTGQKRAAEGDASSSSYSSSEQVRPAKRARLVLKLTPRRPPIKLSLKKPAPARPPIMLSLKKRAPAPPPPTTPVSFRDPFAAERERDRDRDRDRERDRDQRAARELLALNTTPSPAPRLRLRLARPPAPGPAPLPLYRPPPPPVPAHLLGRPLRPAVTPRAPRQTDPDPDPDDTDPDPRGPIITRGMVYAGAKRKRPRED